MILEETTKMLMYPEDFINKIICGDCFKLIKTIPDKEIDCIITDPPYGLNTNGIKNDGDLNLFYNILPECYRVLKDNSFFITFFLETIEITIITVIITIIVINQINNNGAI